MSEKQLVRMERQDGVGVIIVDNPPVNALGPGVPEGIIACVQQGECGPSIKAMVLIGAGAASSPAPISAVRHEPKRPARIGERTL